MFQNLKYQVMQTRLLAPHVTQLVLQPETPAFIDYLPGQYIKVTPDEGEESFLSIANAPSSAHQIELHLGHPAKNARALELLHFATTSRYLSVSGAFGASTIKRLQPDMPVLFYARGTGFAPIKAILEALLLKQSTLALHLFWGVASAADFYLQDLIKGWGQQFQNFRYTAVVCRTVDQHKLRDAVLHDYPDLSGYQVYASGPPEMVFAARDDLDHHGLSRDRLYSDVLDV